MRHILLPTDFSENSYRAMDYAMRYFKGQEINFVVLNIQKSSEYIMGDLMTATPEASIHDAISGDNRKQLEDVVEAYRSKYSGEAFEFKPVFDFDVFIDGISQAILAYNIDLIVMGTNGASGAKEAIFGSNTLQVIRKIKCPVLAIPENYSFHSLDTLLVTIVNGAYPSADALTPLLNFIELHNPEIHLLHINEPGNGDILDGKAEITELFGDRKIVDHFVNNIPAPMAISAFTQLKTVDMHSILIEQKSFLDRFIHGSDTSRLSYSTQVPLLVMHN